MRLWATFNNFEIRDKYINELVKRNFDCSINSFGTLYIEIKYLNVMVEDKILQIENEQRTYNLKLEDIKYFEIQGSVK